MRRNVFIVLGVAALAWGLLAIVLGSPSLRLGSSSSASSDVSPPCLPNTLDHSATIPGTKIDVSPAPQTVTANPHTQISFLGVRPAAIRTVSVVGTHSGAHPGTLRAYSQGDGASFTPSTPLDAGERVRVQATIDGGPANPRVLAYSFSVDTPYSTAGIAEFPNDQAAAADYQSFYTMPGVQAPTLTVALPDRDPAAGDILTTNGPGPGQYGPLIYTPQGRLVWFERLTGGETAEDLNEQTFAGQRDLTWWKGRVLSLGFGQGEDIVMNSRYQPIARVAGGNGLEADLHDFQIRPQSVAYVTAYNPIRCNLEALKGSASGAIVDTAIQQIDMRTGLVRWEWHSLDHIGAAESEVETPDGTSPWDYFHLNSIDPQPDGRVLISARSTWAAYELDGASGRIIWRLGGNKSSFKMGAGTRTAWQHDARMLEDGEITLFDDGSNPPIHRQSRGIRISLDLETHEAHLSAAYTHPSAPVLAPSQGNMQTLGNGNAVVGYGGVPAISEFAPNGTLLFDAHQPLDMSFYRAFRYPWSARPASPPAILASLNNTGEETIVHASWNGATDVAAWRLLAGKGASSLSAQATIPLSGFESSATLTQKFAYAQVQALDAAGHTLASSAAAKVISYAASLPGHAQS